jgi:dTDP-glucose pyrophosphorylase
MDKIVVLARGLGTRMRRTDDGAQLDSRQAAVADAGIKALIPIDRPFLDYVVSAAADAGFRHVCLVVGPEQQALRDYYGSVETSRLDFSFACQEQPKGTANAVAAAEEFAGDDYFAVINSDNYYPVEALRRLREASGNASAVFERDAMFAGSNVSADRLAKFAVVKVGLDGNFERIIEKPDDATLASLPLPIWLSMNCWRFGPSIFKACRAIKPSPRNEYEIPDAVEYVKNVLGEPFAAITVRAPVLDMTSRGDVASVAQKLAGTQVQL